MRKLLRKFLPDHQAVRANRWLRPFESWLLNPDLWHLNRRSAAGAVAAGLFCGLIPGPLQMLGAALCALIFRVNLPLALLTTLYTNPLTIVPLYVAAYEIGRWVNGDGGTYVHPPALDWSRLGDGMRAMAVWALGIGRPLGIGLVLLASGLAMAGYLLVQGGWRLYLILAWRRRQRRPSNGLKS